MPTALLTPSTEASETQQLPRPTAVFGFTAPIEGGKTTLSQTVAARLDLPRVSFGGFLRRTAPALGVPVTREGLQDLGERLVRENPGGFCRALLGESPLPSGKALLIDGVRHAEVLDALTRLFEPTPVYLVFINIDPATQVVRLRTDDLPHRKPLDELQRHSTEVQVRPVLLDRASLILKGTDPLETLVQRVVRLIQAPPEPGVPDWERLNARRIELAKRKNREGLSQVELSEFDQLQTGYFEYMEAKHPRPRLDTRDLDRVSAKPSGRGGEP